MPYSPNPFPDVADLIRHKYAKRSGSYQPRSVHASSVGFPCARRLCYDQLLPPTPREPDAELQQRFAIGDAMEQMTRRDLEDVLTPLGMSVEQSQVPIPVNPLGIGGRVDCKVRITGPGGSRSYPVEIKSMHPFIFDRVESVADLLTHPSPHIRKYPAQLQIYMYYEKDCEWGLFVLRALDGRVKAFPCALDLEYVTQLLDRAGEVTDRVAEAQRLRRTGGGEDEVEALLPVRVSYDAKVCGICPWRSHCLPDLTAAPGIDNRLWDAELDAWCAIREESAKAHEQYEEADEKIRAHAKSEAEGMEEKARRTILTDRYTITVSTYRTTSYAVPADIRDKFKKHGKGVRFDVARVDGRTET